jgi:hypothetical protein
MRARLSSGGRGPGAPAEPLDGPADAAVGPASDSVDGEPDQTTPDADARGGASEPEPEASGATGDEAADDLHDDDERPLRLAEDPLPPIGAAPSEGEEDDGEGSKLWLADLRSSETEGPGRGGS